MVIIIYFRQIIDLYHFSYSNLSTLFQRVINILNKFIGDFAFIIDK